MNNLIQENFILLIEILGTFAFAISGIRLASGKNIDLFGAYIIGLVTAVGGGTTRDLLLNITPFWVNDSRYFITTGVALMATLMLSDKVFKWGNTLFIFDTIGLGLFTVIGIIKSLEAGFPFWACIVMGAITGAVGGIFRDILINEIPLVFRKELYATTCIAGGIVFFICYQLKVPSPFIEIFSAFVVILIRVVAVKFNIHLPILNPVDKNI